MQPLAIPGKKKPPNRGKGQFRPPVGAFIIYLFILFGVEVAAEAWLGDAPPMLKAVLHWSLLVLLIAPVCGVIAWRALQADRALAVQQERDTIRRLALTLLAEYEPDRVPSLMVRQVRELSGARIAFLARPDGDGFRVDTLAGEASSRLVGQRLPITMEAPGIAGEALRSGQPVILTDTWCDLGLASRRELRLSDKIRSAAAIPLVIRNEIVGLIGLFGETVGQLYPAQAEVFQLYAEQAAGPYENAILSASVSQIDAAKQLDQLKSEFLSAVAHELRAPLSPMLGWSELLLARDYSPEQARPMLQNIYEGAQHLSVLVGDLLDLSKGEAGRLQLDLAELDLAELLESAVARWREQAPKHHFVLAVAGALPLQADRHRVRQVLDNLLSNAAKYSPSGSRVFVTARAEPDGRAVIRVSDQGLGLTADEQERMFTKFYRTDSARREATGTGLGLALCKLIVETHGGAIVVESDGPGCGSAFTFTLPAAPPDEAAKSGAAFATIRG